MSWIYFQYDVQTNHFTGDIINGMSVWDDIQLFCLFIDIQCCRNEANEIFALSIFGVVSYRLLCKLCNTEGQWLSMFITLASHGPHGVSDHRQFDCRLISFFGLISKKTSNCAWVSLCEGNPSAIGGFPSQRFINVLNDQIACCLQCIRHSNYNKKKTVREITKSSSIFSATNISSKMIWFFQKAWYNQYEIKAYRNQL